MTSISNILWNSMTSTSFVFTELVNTMKYGGGSLYNLVFTEWRHCVSQNEVWGRGCYITLFSPSDVTAFHIIRKQLTSILSNMHKFHSLEVVDRVSETQFQVGENSDWIIWRLKGFHQGSSVSSIDPFYKYFSNLMRIIMPWCYKLLLLCRQK